MRLIKAVITISMFLLLINLTACKKPKTVLQTHTINQSGEKSLDGIKDILIDAHYLDINLVKTDGEKIKRISTKMDDENLVFDIGKYGRTIYYLLEENH